MIQTVEQLKTQVSALGGPERAELAYFLLASLESEDERSDPTWQGELARRAAEVRAGRAQGRAADEVLAELRERHP
jgi:putative addiction module component (TIGR02574 family)